MLIDMIDSGIARADKYNEFADQITNTPSRATQNRMSNRNSSNLMMGGTDDQGAQDEDYDPWAIE